MRAILFFWALFLCIALGAPQGYAADKGPVEHIPGTSVEMPYLIAPIEADGQLIARAQNGRPTCSAGWRVLRRMTSCAAIIR